MFKTGWKKAREQFQKDIPDNTRTPTHTIYWNLTPIKIPTIYNKDSIICQWLRAHHTKRFREDNGLRN